MRVILFVLCIFLSINLVDNSQCVSRLGLVGPCGCCPLIGGNCISFETIDGMDVSWHVCVPDYLKETFSLKQCQPNITIDKNSTRLCQTKNGTFRFFPQCATKKLCFLSAPRKIFTPQCHTPTAVKGSCRRSLELFSYDPKQNECIPFTFSGCRGSTNRFARKDRCEKLCKKSN